MKRKLIDHLFGSIAIALIGFALIAAPKAWADDDDPIVLCDHNHCPAGQTCVDGVCLGCTQPAGGCGTVADGCKFPGPGDYCDAANHNCTCILGSGCSCTVP
jgi:hypothetical protein